MSGVGEGSTGPRDILSSLRHGWCSPGPFTPRVSSGKGSPDCTRRVDTCTDVEVTDVPEILLPSVSGPSTF